MILIKLLKPTVCAVNAQTNVYYYMVLFFMNIFVFVFISILFWFVLFWSQLLIRRHVYSLYIPEFANYFIYLSSDFMFCVFICVLYLYKGKDSLSYLNLFERKYIYPLYFTLYTHNFYWQDEYNILQTNTGFCYLQSLYVQN